MSIYETCYHAGEIPASLDSFLLYKTMNVNQLMGELSNVAYKGKKSYSQVEVKLLLPPEPDKYGEVSTNILDYQEININRIALSVNGDILIIPEKE